MKKFFTIVFILSLFLVLTACSLFDTTTGLSIEIPTKVEYVLGETFDASGLKVYAHRSNGQVLTLSDDAYKLSSTDLNRTGSHKIRVTHDGQEADFTVYVKEVPTTIVMVYITDFAETVFYAEVPTAQTLKTDGLGLAYLTANHDTSVANLSDFSITIIDLEMMDNDYEVYVVMLNHKTLEGISTSFLVYVG